MDPAKITELAQLLRESGDKVLNDKYKLTLSGQLLQGLSNLFHLIVDDADELLVAGGNGGIHGADDASHFQVVSKYHNLRSPEMRDLQLIYDFVQKTRILCVTNFAATQDADDAAFVDITKFRNLRRLEISKLSVARVRGIQKMRAHLQELKCVQAIESVEEIISHCGGDRCNGFMWNELHTVDFSYNTLRTVDGSLEFLTSLQYLNLSHNQIVSVDAIKWLKNLKFLNLSFNRLQHVPLLHVEAPRRLKVLILSNNYIEDMTGLSRLEALCELDMSDNYLIDHSTLLPLSTLIALQMLNLAGNPLACHSKHREATAKFLHKNTTTGRFSLDNAPLSKFEKSLTGKQQSMLNSRLPFFSFSRRSNATASVASSSRLTTTDNSPASSVGSLRSFRMDDSTTGSLNTSDIVHRKIRPKTVTISEHPPGAEPSTASAKQPPTLLLETNTAHLETKKQIEEMCRLHGDSWLKTHGAKLGHVVGSNNVGDIGGSPMPIVVDRFVEMQSSTPVGSSQTQWQRIEAPIVAAGVHLETSSGYQTATDCSDSDVRPVVAGVTDAPASAPANDLADIFPTTDEDATADSLSDSEDNEVVYIVTLQPNLQEMMLVVSDVNIREKDALTAQTVTRWSMSMLESCDRMRTDVLRLNFDTLNRDKRERIYRVETGLCQQLERYLRSVLAQRPLSAMNQVMYRCVKCGGNFSREHNPKGKTKGALETRCPSCGSTFLVEIHESPPTASGLAVLEALPPPNVLRLGAVGTAEVVTEVAAEPNGVDVPVELSSTALEVSESRSSIGSAHSLNESSSCSRISKSSSFDSNRSVDGSYGLAGRCRRAADFAADNQSLESEVEILSNPSQSSIEVLEYNSSRKHSEDRRYDDFADLEAYQQSMTLTLDTVADQINRLSLVMSPATPATTQHQQTSTRDLVALIDSDAVAGAEVAPAVTEEQAHEKRQRPAAVATATATSLLATTVLGQTHLTESSSSGSVTDSICTTYDQNQRTITNSNSSSIIGDGTRSPEKTASNGGKQDASMISSMLGGLFQSTNNLMSRSQRHTEANTTNTTDPFKFSYTDFENVDHRLKLYLYQTVFEDDNEQLKWLVRGQVLLERPDASKSLSGPAVFVMSTTKFYVLQIVAMENDDVSKWVKRQLSGTIDRLQMVRVLPWKIGLMISIKGIGKLQLLLQDILRTDSLLLFLANNPLPDTCQLKYQTDEFLAQRLLLTTDNAPLKMLAILDECTYTATDASTTTTSSGDEQRTPTTAAINSQNNAPTHKLLGLVVTETCLYLLETAHCWLAQPDDNSDAIQPGVVIAAPVRTMQQQLMNNLVAAERLADRVVRLIYLEEMQDRQEEWTCTFETADNASSTLDAVGQSWERLFGVPLTLSK